MTLNTRFYITTPGIDPDTVWQALLDMVEPRDFHLTRDEYTEEGSFKYGPPGAVCRNTKVGIGLNAWCFMYYNADGSMISLTDENDIRTFIRLDFDTAYGYRGPGGESCSQLHGRIVTYLAGAVTALGGEYIWQDEYTGEWYTDLSYVPEFGRS